MAPSLTESDNGKTIPLKVGVEATLRLPENPSTGYRWALDAADSSVAAIKEQSYDGASKPGAGGVAQWAIKAAAPGSTTIKLKRWRPWEGDASVVERYEITVSVSP
jgi:inhibitor of cysteine peptidase